MTSIDLTILDNEPEALAEITKALAKVYFDNVLDRRYNIEPISKAYSIAFNLCPNYRIILKDKYPEHKHCKDEITSLPSNPSQSKEVVLS